MDYIENLEAFNFIKGLTNDFFCFFFLNYISEPISSNVVANVDA